MRVNYWEINQATSKYQMDCLDKFSKKNVNNKKSEQHYQILHIQNSLGTKFQFKLAILNFRSKLTQEKKNENYHQILRV